MVVSHIYGLSFEHTDDWVQFFVNIFKIIFQHENELVTAQIAGSSEGSFDTINFVNTWDKAEEVKAKVWFLVNARIADAIVVGDSGL